MSMRAVVFLGIALVNVPAQAAAQDRPAREVVDLIVREGPRATAARARVDPVRREQDARLSYPNPSITYSREGAGFTEFFQAEQTLQLFGTRAALARAGVAATSAAEAERDAALWALRTRAETAVAGLIAGQQRLEIAGSYRSELERLIEVLRTREREGEGSRFDRLRAEEELHESRQAETTAAVAAAEARAAVLAMLPPGVTLTRVTGSLYEARELPPVADLQARAEASRPELKALGALADRTGLEADAARKARLPSPALFGGLKRADTDTGRVNGGLIGVSLSVPTFDRGARDVARWSSERLLIEAERAALVREIRVEIERATEVMSLRRAAVDADQGAASAELVTIATVAYRDGAVGILELIDAHRAASRARFRSLDILFETRLAQVALERAVGDILWP